jgi:hypothetical protein
VAAFAVVPSKKAKNADTIIISNQYVQTPKIVNPLVLEKEL